MGEGQVQSEGGFSRDEIESHSSALTNQRISNLSRLVCAAEMDANNALAPTIQHAIAYHSSLLTFYYETNEAYDKPINEKMREAIEACYIKGEMLARYLKQHPNALQKGVEDLISNSKLWRYLMHKGLQNLKYWFRLGKHDPKGIKQILNLFKGQKETITNVKKGEQPKVEVKKLEDKKEEPKKIEERPEGTT